MSKRTTSLTPEGPLGKIRFAIEGWLYRHGFSNADARLLISVQFMCTAVLVLLGAAVCWYSPWLLWIGLGAMLAVANFFFVAQKLQAFFPLGFNAGKIVRMLLNFYLRLFITAIFLFVFIAWLKAPIPALLIGLSLSAGTAIIFGLTKLHMLKSKEA